MDITVVPEFVEEKVWDLDITYLGGVLHQHTLRTGHVLKETTAHLVVTIPHANGEGVLERVVCERKNILTFSVRERIMRTPKTPDL